MEGFESKMAKDIDIKEIQKDLSEYLAKKYGRRVQFAGFGPIPEPSGEKMKRGKRRKSPSFSNSFRYEAGRIEGLSG